VDKITKKLRDAQLQAQLRCDRTIQVALWAIPTQHHCCSKIMQDHAEHAPGLLLCFPNTSWASPIGRRGQRPYFSGTKKDDA
jgi:hypothetical protein